MTYRICKGCNTKVQLIIKEEKGKLTFYPLDRLNYCDECWDKKMAGEKLIKNVQIK